MNIPLLTGRRVRLRPATLADRPMVFDWSRYSDVAPLLHLSDAPSGAVDDDWEEHFFLDGSPELGRMFVVLEGEGSASSGSPPRPPRSPRTGAASTTSTAS